MEGFVEKRMRCVLLVLKTKLWEAAKDSQQCSKIRNAAGDGASRTRSSHSCIRYAINRRLGRCCNDNASTEDRGGAMTIHYRQKTIDS